MYHNMQKTFRALFCALSMLLALSVSAQPVSKESLKQVFLISGNAEQYISQSPERMQQLTTIAKMANPSLSDDEAKDKVLSYIRNDSYSDFVDVVAPYFSSLSEPDAALLLQLMSSDTFQNACSKVLNASSQIQTSMQLQLTAGLQQILAGSEPSVPVMTVMPDSYMTAFEKYCTAAGFDESIDGAVASVQQTLSSIPDCKDKMDKISSFMKQVSKIATFNALAAAVSEADLNVYSDVFNTEAGQHFVDGTKKMAADAFNMSMAYGQKVIERLR